jgi:hypothetical protein
MSQWPDWTPQEFDAVVSAPNASPEELARQLGSRTPGAVSWVQAGMHGYHTSGDVSPLSHMMRSRLDTRSAPVVCPQCKAQF